MSILASIVITRLGIIQRERNMTTCHEADLENSNGAVLRGWSGAKILLEVVGYPEMVCGGHVLTRLS